MLFRSYTPTFFSKLFEKKTNKYLKNQSNWSTFLIASLRITLLKKKLINLFNASFVNLYIFKKINKIINDIPLKSLTFQIGQTNWNRDSNNKELNNINLGKAHTNKSTNTNTSTTR